MRKKTKCYFNKTCNRKDEILNTLSVKEGMLPVKYLGVPLSSNKITDRECAILISSIWDRLQGWSSRLLSLASRIELVHTVIHYKINFWLQIFQLPDASIQKIENVYANFLWKGGLHKIKF